ncbi:MAG: hypothetical protein K6L73_02490 [Cellvibrionaceae bacterium]
MAGIQKTQEQFSGVWPWMAGIQKMQEQFSGISMHNFNEIREIKNPAVCRKLPGFFKTLESSGRLLFAAFFVC